MNPSVDATLPLPFTVTVSVFVVDENVAVTEVVALVRATSHVGLVPHAAIDQPPKVLDGSAAAPSWMGVVVKSALAIEHVVPQEMPGVTFEVTVPAPAPALTTVRVAKPVPASDAAATPPGSAETVSDA